MHKWQEGRDSNPNRAILETAVLPIKLPTYFYGWDTETRTLNQPVRICAYFYALQTISLPWIYTIYYSFQFVFGIYLTSPYFYYTGHR